MYCPNCGSCNDDNAPRCEECGQVFQAYQYPQQSAQRFEQMPRVPNHLVWAILATLFCCQPTGIVAIVYAAQVDSKLSAGDYQGALESSQNAKTWAWISFIPIAVMIGFGIFAAILDVMIRM